VSELSRDWDVHPEIVGGISSKQVHGMCTVYVDDVFFTGDVKYMKWFEKKLTDRFKCKPANWNESKYLGMMLKATNDGAVELRSDGYERCIQEISISPERAREMESFLIESEERDFRNMLGKAMWSARITRADCMALPSILRKSRSSLSIKKLSISLALSGDLTISWIHLSYPSLVNSTEPSFVALNFIPKYFDSFQFAALHLNLFFNFFSNHLIYLESVCL
jgi:hypothetical protein